MITGFVADPGNEAAALFAQVLLECDRPGLIGRERSAIDERQAAVDEAQQCCRLPPLSRPETPARAVRRRH